MDEAIAATRHVTLPTALAEPTVPVKGSWISLHNLPLVVAPLAAGVVLGLMNSSAALFALAGLVTVMAAWTVSHVRSVS
jgi:hypothetical protein